MPTYDYKCDQTDCQFQTEEFFAIAERDRPVGTQCPACAAGKVVRAVTTPHMQDVAHTEQQKCSKDVKNPTGQMREKLQGMIDIKNQQTGLKQKRWLKDRYNL